jgi:hypothetical protein
MFPNLRPDRARPLRIAPHLTAIAMALFGLGLAGCRLRMTEANTANAASGPARLVVPETSLELGQGVPGEELAGSLLLKNAGGEPLHIERLEAGCGCALLDLPERTIPSGAVVTMNVAVRIKEEGQHLRFPIRIYSNDPVDPQTVCTVRAEAAPALLRTEPGQINFGEVALGTAPVKRLKLLKPDGAPWPAKEPITAQSEYSLAHIDKGFQEGAAAVQGLVLDIRPRADLPAGNFSDTLTVRPADSKRVMRIPVLGIIVPRVVLSPSGLYFGEVERDSGILKRRVMLRRTDGKAVNRIARSEGPPGIKLTEVKPGDEAIASDRERLLVTLDTSLVTQEDKDGKLLLWLEHEPEPLVIRIMVYLAKKALSAEQ